MQEAFLAYLTGAGSGLPALVGTRVAWGLNDQAAALPRVSLRLVSGVPLYSDDGDANLTEVRVQIDCHATTAEGAALVGRAVIARLSGVYVTQGDIEFQGIYVDNFDDDPKTYDGGRTVFEYQVDVITKYKELS
jgi:hypothetical protein